MESFSADAGRLLIFLIFVLYCSVSALQLALYVFFIRTGWQKILRKESETTPTPLIYPALSLLMCARNEATNLKKHLPSLLGQAYSGRFDLLVVNDASSDDSRLILQSFENQFTQFKAIHLATKTQAGKKAALSTGIQAAQHEWLVLTDADCEPASPDWLTSMARHMQQPEIDIVLGFGPLLPEPGFLNQWARFETNHTAFLYGGMAGMGMPYMGVGRNLAFKKKLFEEQHGYQKHAHFASGDDDLLINAAANSKNTAICTDAQATMYSAAAANWPQWFRQKKRHLSVSHVYKPVHQLLLTLFAGTLVFHYFLLLLTLLGVQYALPALGIYVLRQGALQICYKPVFKRLKSNDLLLKTPLFDMMLALYFGLLVPYNLIFQRKKIVWKP